MESAHPAAVHQDLVKQRDALERALIIAEASLQEATQALETAAHHTVGKRRTESLGNLLLKRRDSTAASWAEVRSALASLEKAKVADTNPVVGAQEGEDS